MLINVIKDLSNYSMWLYIRHILQLLLSPARGWEDISGAVQPAEDIQRRGFFPWIAVSGLSEFLRLFYGVHGGFFAVFLSAIAMTATLFVSLYFARLIMDIALPRYVDSKISVAKINVFATYMMGINGLFLIIANALPASMTFTRFLPILSIVVMFKASVYLAIREENLMAFLGIATAAVIIVPIALGMILLLFV